MKPRLSASPSPISVGDDDADDDDDAIDHTIGRSAGWQAATQQTREQTRTTNGAALARVRRRRRERQRQRRRHGYEVDSAPFPPPRRPCPRAHTKAGSPDAAGDRGGPPSVAAAAARTNPLKLHGRAMNTDRRGDLTAQCRGHSCRGSWAVVCPGGRGRLRVRRQRGW